MALSCKTVTMSTCRGISRQLQKFDLRRIRIYSKIDVLHIFKARMMKVCLQVRSFQSNKQTPCSHRVLSLSHQTFFFVGIRTFQKIQCLIVSQSYRMVVLMDCMPSRYLSSNLRMWKGDVMRNSSEPSQQILMNILVYIVD